MRGLYLISIWLIDLSAFYFILKFKSLYQAKKALRSSRDKINDYVDRQEDPHQPLKRDDSPGLFTIAYEAKGAAVHSLPYELTYDKTSLAYIEWDRSSAYARIVDRTPSKNLRDSGGNPVHGLLIENDSPIVFRSGAVHFHLTPTEHYLGKVDCRKNSMEIEFEVLIPGNSKRVSHLREDGAFVIGARIDYDLPVRNVRLFDRRLEIGPGDNGFFLKCIERERGESSLFRVTDSKVVEHGITGLNAGDEYAIRDSLLTIRIIDIRKAS
jgi:hypothetical protein